MKTSLYLSGLAIATAVVMGGVIATAVKRTSETTVGQIGGAVTVTDVYGIQSMRVTPIIPVPLGAGTNGMADQSSFRSSDFPRYRFISPPGETRPHLYYFPVDGSPPSPILGW